MSARLLVAADAAQASIRGCAEPPCQHWPKSGAMLSTGGVRGVSSGLARGKPWTPLCSCLRTCMCVPAQFALHDVTLQVVHHSFKRETHTFP